MEQPSSVVPRAGKYERGRVLGESYYSTIRECTDATTKEKFAVKIIDKSKLAEEQLEEYGYREISIMKQLRHPFVVSMKEVLQTTTRIYIVLELVTGGDLVDKIVQSERLPENLARKYFQQLIVAVRHCHKNGIAHRDLKPENILLDQNRDIKVSDFSVGNIQAKLDTMRNIPSSAFCYIAPEVFHTGQLGYDAFAADIWSCGVILYAMLSGRQAFDDLRVRGLCHKIARCQYKMSRYFTEGACNLISKILVVDPEKRYNLNDIIKDPWFRAGFDPSLLEIGVSASNAELNHAAKNSTIKNVDENFFFVPALSSNDGIPKKSVAAEDDFA